MSGKEIRMERLITSWRGKVISFVYVWVWCLIPMMTGALMLRWWF